MRHSIPLNISHVMFNLQPVDLVAILKAMLKATKFSTARRVNDSFKNFMLTESCDEVICMFVYIGKRRRRERFQSIVCEIAT